MNSDIVKNQLENLEKSIRYLVRDSEWIMLEPVDKDLLSEFQYLERYVPETKQQVKPSQITRPRSISPKTQEAPQFVPDQIIHSRAEVKSAIQPNKTEIPELNPMEATNLDSLKLRLKDCNRCKLCENRTTVVFGQGNQHADLVFIGEGPGEEEDRTGLAFVGKAGKLLTQMIHSIGLNRESVYICNVVKCRPPGNRNPSTDEITTCYPFLTKQIEFLKPKLIVTLGNVATKAIVPGALGIMKMRGRMIDHHGIPLMPTFHPSYLLRNPSALANVWTDMRKIRQAFHQQASNNQT